MSADNRSVATDALATLGTIIGPDEKRDAIHLAVEPVIAKVRLQPGMHVGIYNGVASPEAQPFLGIVDPFIERAVQPGERFWLIVYPRQITSLRHVWEHPDFPSTEIEGPSDENAKPSSTFKATSEQWLRAFISTADCPDYETVIAKALNNEGTWDSEYLHFNGLDAHGDIPPEFWVHLEIVTGRSVPVQDRAKYFSCSC
jgi:hypothetical protein